MEATSIPREKIAKIFLSLASPSTIKELASAKIVTPELYDKEGYPVDGGLMDVRLGAIDPGLKCKTCGGKLKECIGHFGYIELARPVIHIKFVNVIFTLLRFTCRECGRILLPPEKIKKLTKHLEKAEEEGGLEARRLVLKAAITSLKTEKCPHCKAKQKSIKLIKPYDFSEDGKKLTPIDIRARLERIPDEDLAVFGIKPEHARPEWMVLTVLPIPPVTMRPSITLETGERSEDDLTHKLGDIVRINQRLFENINAGAPEIIIEDLWGLLQYHITTYFDNTISQLPPARHRTGEPLKTLTERIKSKEGRIRHNLAGKRTNFSSRTVISPDPMIELNEVGVPVVVAMKLTVPVRVTESNIEALKEFVKRGPDKYPGANYIIRPDGKKKKITEETKEQLLEELAPGYIVERHLMDKDIAVYNRQPSLHRMSMMCHKVRVLPFLTFRHHPAVSYPYNADFDGDEMNLHIPQTEEARAEAETLMAVQKHIISPRHGLGVIGCIQDAITGNYLLTKSVTLSRKEAIDLLASIGIEDFSALPDKEEITGKECLSVLFPEDFDFEEHSKKCQRSQGGKCHETCIKIKKGKLLHGVLDKNSLGGEAAGLLLRTLHKRYGPEFTADFLGKIFRLGIKTLLMLGFTTTISDTDLPEEAHRRINEIIENAYQRVYDYIDSFISGKMEPLPGRTTEETLELRSLETLNKARNECGKVVMAYGAKNSGTKIMAESGARGTYLNLAQMAASVGQQAMRGKRIEKGYFNRTLSVFKQGDRGPAARGFIKSSFKAGLLPHEYFFAAITGRDALMDTALRTPKSGYLYRRLANALQDLKAEYDGTVRDSGGNIIQFEYGEDGIDVSKSENGKINVRRIVASFT